MFNKKNRKLSIFILEIATVILLLLLLYYFVYDKKTKEDNNKNITLSNIYEQQEIEKSNSKIISQKEKMVIKKVQEKKIELKNRWVFTDKEHKAIREGKGKDYIIDFKYGVGYVNKFGNIIYGIDPKIESERKQIEQKIINKIKGYCKLNKFQVKDYGGLEGMKKFFNELFTYYNGNIFLEKEKIDLTQKYIDKYCKTYNPLLKEIIKKTVVLSFFDFDTNSCKINISGKNNVNIVCKENKKKIKENEISKYFFIKNVINNNTTKDKSYKKERVNTVIFIK